MGNTTKGIWELRKEVEQRNGRPVKIYSAYPLIGRGSVIHELTPHSDVEKKIRESVAHPTLETNFFCDKQGNCSCINLAT